MGRNTAIQMEATSVCMEVVHTGVAYIQICIKKLGHYSSYDSSYTLLCRYWYSHNGRYFQRTMSAILGKGSLVVSQKAAPVFQTKAKSCIVCSVSMCSYMYTPCSLTIHLADRDQNHHHIHLSIENITVRGSQRYLWLYLWVCSSAILVNQGHNYWDIHVYL